MKQKYVKIKCAVLVLLFFCMHTAFAQNTCFSLGFKNESKKDSCFLGERLQFTITAQANSNITGYEIYTAPVNNLNNQRLLFSLPYPSSSFYISSILLDANTAYAIFVKQISKKKQESCLQYIMPVIRCANACKDVKLPR
jgi:hypothetical protein